MKQGKKNMILAGIITLIALAFLLLSCNSSHYVIAGRATNVTDTTVTVNGLVFKTNTDTLKVGDSVTFISTKNRKQINSRLLTRF